ncbi:MAG: GTP cyclohydrolase, FolE2/MptA family [Candidatus Altiarchaeota archaeon]
MKKETQDKNPKISENLERVGVTNLRTIVKTKWRGHDYRFIPRIQLTIDLKKDRKGIHMSRLVESISETIEEETMDVHRSIEELGRTILERLKEKHDYERGEIVFETELVTIEKTPVTQKDTMEAHDVKVTVRNRDGLSEKTLEVNVVGNTVCPHSLEKTGGKTHVQRALGTLTISTYYDNKITLEEMIKAVEKSFSSKVYTILKTEDEMHVVNTMMSNPKFVEDVAREILYNAKKFRKSRVNAKVVSMESIHRHDVIAEGQFETF